ncbi:hypothetical protein CAEBREN_21277 [Caenorhabditis brenneri]|uniref:Uncharacterized protein n=1 Tax=Caenorhabditis brenneri TaxID=135651 RepID=G0MQR9_CAEBE|nr:hypothetical protein CAEBREN_21277 [Caenorhabditis brenneri]
MDRCTGPLHGVCFYASALHPGQHTAANFQIVVLCGQGLTLFYTTVRPIFIPANVHHLILHNKEHHGFSSEYQFRELEYLHALYCYDNNRDFDLDGFLEPTRRLLAEIEGNRAEEIRILRQSTYW